MPGASNLSVTNGSATFGISSLSPGSHSITAVYSGCGTGFSGSTSSVVTQVVNATTTTSLVRLRPSNQGDSVTFTATISPNPGNLGTVTFLDNGVAIPGGSNIAVSSGSATFATSSLSPGSHSITAVYSGTTGFAASTSTVVTQIVDATTTTSLIAKPNATTGGTLVTFTATISPSPDTLGTVTFRDNGVAMPGGSNVALVGGVATFQIATLSAIVHPITAAYSGAAGFVASMSSLNFTVSAATTTTLSVGSPNPATSSESISSTSPSPAAAPLTANPSSFATPATATPSSRPPAGRSPAAARRSSSPPERFRSARTISSPIMPATASTPPANRAPSRRSSRRPPRPPSSPSRSMAISRRSAACSIRASPASSSCSINRSLSTPTPFRCVLHTNSVTYSGVSYPTGFGTLPTSPLVITPIDSQNWIVTFSGNVDLGADGFASIKDGVYNFAIDGSKVHLASAPAITMAGNSNTVFHRLFGEINDPETPLGGTPDVDFVALVNTVDNLVFRIAFNNVANYNAYLDFDGDGFIVTADNFAFRNRFNRELTWRV